MSILNKLTQKLLFVVGKGGVGRTTVCASMATHYASQGERVLVVQWAFKDAISPIYSQPECSHKESLLPSKFYVMNYSATEAIREYFVDHLKLKLLHTLVIENKHVQKLINSAPGIHELFFLGRLFWLVDLAQTERGISYDRVIVDCPATGHAVSLFGIAPAVAQFGMTGPLATECERVTKILNDTEKTGVVVVTLPEELPVEECLETIPKIHKQINRNPLAVFVNQSIHNSLFPVLDHFAKEEWYLNLLSRFQNPVSKIELNVILSHLIMRNHYEDKLRHELNSNYTIPIYSLPDIGLLSKNNTPQSVIQLLTQYFLTLS